MNWIEIDKILYGIIERHNDVEDMLKEAKAQFKWDSRQAETALLPLLKRHTLHKIVTPTSKSRSKRAINSKK